MVNSWEPLYSDCLSSHCRELYEVKEGK
ncbi:BnaC06g01740D [Brassica napus]|uniref:BnaC06g01740D protein n=1 Tax=Brassica napus TaxID=3708 RepID=A0A078I117_BRANA|nr:BnaC06g01740D [Brassica napus]